MPRHKPPLLLRLCALVASVPWIAAALGIARRIAVPAGPAAIKVDRRAWGAIRARFRFTHRRVPA